MGGARRWAPLPFAVESASRGIFALKQGPSVPPATSSAHAPLYPAHGGASVPLFFRVNGRKIRTEGKATSGVFSCFALRKAARASHFEELLVLRTSKSCSCFALRKAARTSRLVRGPARAQQRSAYVSAAQQHSRESWPARQLERRPGGSCPRYHAGLRPRARVRRNGTHRSRREPVHDLPRQRSGCRAHCARWRGPRPVLQRFRRCSHAIRSSARRRRYAAFELARRRWAADRTAS